MTADAIKIQTVCRIAAEILGLDPAALDTRSGVDRTEGWDSLKNLTILMEVEAQAGACFSPEDMAEARTVGAIAARLP